MRATLRPSTRMDGRFAPHRYNIGARWEALSLPGHTCRWCGQGMSYLYLDNEPGGPWPADLALCVRCVRRALARMTVSLHGDVADAASNHHPDHDDRMADHTSRIRANLARMHEDADA